ncbi:hypothetical protein [Brevundimonas sp. GCM10030266]|uniref:hypothetical protein n=1 Tax=Brevundimonas sp. GCM10030266 TaxID=3273386 RepID=UPI003620C65D
MTSAEGRLRPARPRPGRIFYLVALLPMILGFAAMGVILATQLPKMKDGLQQIVVPGAREVALEPGTHTVFLETRSVVEGRAYVVDEVPGLQVRVEDAEGASVALSDPAASSTYSLGGRQGRSIGAFRIEQAGIYRVSADYGEGGGPQAVIAVGRDFIGGLLISIFSSLGAVFAGLGLTVGLAIWIYVSRHRARAGD